MVTIPPRLHVPLAALSGALLALAVVAARVDPVPVPVAVVHHVVTLHATGDPYAPNLVILPGDVRTRSPYGTPFTVPAGLLAVVVVATAPDAGGTVGCSVTVDDVTVSESGDGPRATAACAWPPG